jgi:hypothetical protein
MTPSDEDQFTHCWACARSLEGGRTPRLRQARL